MGFLLIIDTSFNVESVFLVLWDLFTPSFHKHKQIITIIEIFVVFVPNEAMFIFNSHLIILGKKFIYLKKVKHWIRRKNWILICFLH